MIGRSGERGSGISVLAARHDDDIYMYIKKSFFVCVYICIIKKASLCVCVCVRVYIYIYIYIYI